jgi:hypothetical protein
VTARTQSPTYKLVIGADDAFGVSETVDTEVVSDGFWMMVPPLPTGLHELTFKGSFCVPEHAASSRGLSEAKGRRVH